MVSFPVGVLGGRPAAIGVFSMAAGGGLVTATGYDMDTGRRVKFWASREALSAYFADPDEDAYIDVQDRDVIKVTGRPGRDLWATAGLDQQPS